MRKFTMVSPMLWKDKRFRSLKTDGAKLAMLYFITSPHQNSAGCYHLPDGYACADMGVSEADYKAFRKEVSDAGLIVFDDDTSEIYIVGWFEDNPITNDNHFQGCERLINTIDSDKVAEAAGHDLQASHERHVSAQDAKAQRRRAAAPEVPEYGGPDAYRRAG